MKFFNAVTVAVFAVMASSTPIPNAYNAARDTREASIYPREKGEITYDQCGSITSSQQQQQQQHVSCKASVIARENREAVYDQRRGYEEVDSEAK